MHPKNTQTSPVKDSNSYLNDELYLAITKDKAYFDFIQKYALDGFFIIDGQEDENVFCSPKLLESLGYDNTKSAKNKKIWKDIIYSEDLNQFEKVLASKAINTSQEENLIFRFVHSHKYILWLECAIISFKNISLKNRILIAVKNVTKFKKSDLHLQEQVKRYEHVLDGTGIGTWEWNIQTGETIFSKQWAKILGYGLEELQPTSVDTWNKFANPEDAEYCQKILNEHFEGKTEVYKTEARMRHKKGHWVWVADRGKVVSWTEDGRPEWMTGYHEEITRQKKEIERSQKFIEEAPTAIAMFDTKMRYIVTSKKWKEDYHVEDIDIINKYHYDIFPDVKDEWKAIHLLGLKGESLLSEDDEFIDRFGKKRYVKWSMQPWYTNEQEIGGIIIHTTDITQLKKLKQISESRKQFLETILESLKVGIVSCNAKGELELFNSTTREWHGLPVTAMDPDKLSDYYGLYHEDGKTHLTKDEIPLLQVLENGYISNSTIRIKPKYGEDRLVSVSGSQIKDNNGKIIGAVVAMHDITSYKQSQEKLRLSEETFRGNFENAAIGMAICDLNAKPLKVNKSLCSILKYSQNELLKKPIFELVNQKDFNRIHRLIKELVHKKEDHFHVELQLISKKNEKIYVLIFASLITDSNGEPLLITMQIKNISIRKLAQQQLNKALAHQKALLAASTKVSFIATDKEGLITDFNLGAENLLGHKAENIKRKNVLLFHDPKEIAQRIESLNQEFRRELTNFEALVFEAKKRKSTTREWSYLDINKNRIPILLTITPILQDEQLIGYLHAALEITELKEARNEILSLLEVTKDQNQRLRNFANIVSHNLRSHSCNFSSLLDLLKIECSELNENQIIQLLRTASENLKETIEHLNEVVVINTLIKENLSRLNLHDFIEKAVESTSALAMEAQVNIEFNIDKNINILGIPAYLESILLNFITNGIKYRSLERNSFIKLYAENDLVNGETILNIEDNGLGIDLKRNRHKLFGMYNTFHKHKDSRGIGLFITKNQIEAIGGKIEVESEVNKGTLFKIYFKNEEN
ncbi:PAS domain S-box protein [Zunongwangia pacifica]|uniref:histidine kinase n=1 Tax=Zunongwangia pacifica TaxID=2911062 RepID=A0A9X1ZXB4_9FLAO|nr:PAS domain S-box protein [Zunongwangia pacifica]MCL6220243.1 PAS domain S-box protein [Zunongwangia pacifica]